MAEAIRIPPRCGYFIDVQLWPRTTSVNPAQWLSNFKTDELRLANRLLEGFVYYSKELTENMFRGGFANISQYVVKNKINYLTASNEWARFLSAVKIVRVTGEEPNDSDSGYTFSRLSRDMLGISQKQIVSPEAALDSLIRNPKQNIVFVDDFVGSGNQFIETWRREYTFGSSKYSYQSVVNSSPQLNTIFYAPVICTKFGLGEIIKVAPTVKIVPAHLIGEQYSAISNNSIIWRKDMQSEGPSFVEQKSKEIGLPDLNGEEGCWRGFNKLGLALSFAHGWPDATLPIFYSNDNGWKPLLRKPAR
jgi:hypothetical protein